MIIRKGVVAWMNLRNPNPLLMHLKAVGLERKTMHIPQGWYHAHI